MKIDILPYHARKFQCLSLLLARVLLFCSLSKQIWPEIYNTGRPIHFLYELSVLSISFTSAPFGRPVASDALAFCSR